MKEVLLTIAGAGFCLGYGYYYVRLPAKAAEDYTYEGNRLVSERQVRVIGWTLLAIGLLLFYSGTRQIIEALM
jgi:uncharacterized protein YjeT (DUF2065 family)